MTGQPQHVVVVGAGLGGIRTAEQLRTAGFRGKISLVGAEQHLPYDRPPLSKQVLTGEWDPERIVLCDKARLDELGISARFGEPAVALHDGAVELADGTRLQGDAIVAATGVAARRLPDQPDTARTLRTLDDTLALQNALATARSLLIVGAGFVGAEVAGAARARGVDVTVLEAMPVPFIRALGPEIGAVCARLLTEGGVDLRTGALLERFTGGSAVELADGTRLDADVMLVGIGGVPELGWLASTGIDTSDGVPCDARGRVEGVAGMWAVGDIAAWTDPVRGGRHRSEHWTNATDQAAAVARDIVGADAPPLSTPYFWSDQFGLKIQLVGRPDLADTVLPLHGAGLDGGPVKGTVAAYFAGARLVGVVGFGAARLIARYRGLVGREADRAEVLALATSE
ncbi:FAD-dependent oxidoreductase [Streptomyces viridosporus]|uniref:NAD(P)/FAD-dependent oxidoreductase n=1 Tax=Streptomyces viridosporus TaxID=67581 RepID=UPI00341EEF35